ncbi:inhibin alpha chain isoform X2 [Kryptolebias marmoratus]|uniref:Inhibin alpha chain n=1 Tax=Kryptolebias marmoratus TaxID=37003 RepID=A0A3Q3EPL2_KRYMA|nr:inhibin alpha chain isoform X2 [Kryptolebias marmoratus]
MVSCAVLVLDLLWIQTLAQACEAEELPRGVLLSWFRERVLEALGLEEPPVVQGPEGHGHMRVPRSSRAAWGRHRTSPDQEASERILFPTSDSSCADSEMGKSTNSCSTFSFQASVALQASAVTSADLWFFSGEGVNSSALLLILPSGQQLLQAPAGFSSARWSTFHLDGRSLTSAAAGPFLFRVCCRCRCHANDPDKTPFLHLHVQPRSPVRSPRAAATGTIPWSPSAVHLLQRPSQERPQQDDCRREEIQISFEELGWDNWIVHPAVLSFYYCQGNCSARDRTAAVLGISQCCAPVPETMRSLRITTTSDGGHSFKHETLPNIIPEECTCF